MTTGSGETLDSLLRRQASALPQYVAFRYLGDGEHETEQLTYAGLDQRARALAARLQALEAPGRPVLLVYEGGLEPLVAFFGCLYAGLIAVPLAPPRPRQPGEALAAVAADAGARVALTSQSLLARLADEPAWQKLHWLATDALAPEDGAPAWRPPATTPADLAALLYTSGSTSEPKGVMLTHQALTGPRLRLPPGFRLIMTPTSVAWMPLYQIAGLSNALLVVRVGKGTAVHLPPERVLAQPRLWLQAISHYRAIVAGGPNFLYQRCVDDIPPAERAGLDLRSWQFATCLAEPVRANTLAQFAEAYAPAGFNPRAFVPAYGLSEQQGVASARAGRLFARKPRVVTFDRAALAEDRVQVLPAGAAGGLPLVGNGRLVAGATVRIVDPATAAECPPGQVGEVWAASPYAASGYWQQPAATAETFQAHLAGSGAGPFLRTGDLGFLYDTELFICGRLKEMIIVRGQNHYVQDIEAVAVASHPDLGSAAAAFTVPAPGATEPALLSGEEQVILYCEVRPECAAPDVAGIAAAVRHAVSGALQLPLQAVVLVPAGALPRTGVGKIRRYQVRADYLAQRGALATGAAGEG